LHKFAWIFVQVTGEFADKPTRCQSSRGLVNLWTSQVAEIFDLKFEVYNRSHVISGRLCD